MKWLTLFLFCIFIESIYSQPSAEELLKSVEDNFKKINDYTAEVLASIEMERLRIPRRKVKIYFKQPNKLHLEAEGFAMIPRAGFGFIPSQLSPEKYDAEIIKLDTIGEISAYKIKMELQNLEKQLSLKDISLRNFYLWIETKNRVIKKIETESFGGKSVTVTFDYGWIEKMYYLPSNITVTLDNISGGDIDIPDMPGAESRPRRLPRTGSITLTFTKYTVNQNLPDSLFEKNEKQ